MTVASSRVAQRPANVSVPVFDLTGERTVAAVSAQVAQAEAGPVKLALDNLGQLLSTLPATPVTDFLGGSLWLVRRTLNSLDSAIRAWAPTPCACVDGAPAATVLTVTSAVDGASGSLRQVLGSASDGDVIRFAPNLRRATLTLTEGELDVDVSVRIEGTGQTLDAAGLSRIMVLDQPGTSISLSDLIFVGGSAPGDPTRATAGGAILAEGVTLQICGSSFVGNQAVSAGPAQAEASFVQLGLGGAIAAFDSVVSISDSVFSRNRAVGGDNTTNQQASGALGGAIFAGDRIPGAVTELVLRRSQFTDNSAIGGSGVVPIAAFPTSDGGRAAGGAVYSDRAALSAAEIDFVGNSVTGGDGLDGSESNPYGNEVGAGGNAAGGAVWIEGRGVRSGVTVPLDLQQVNFMSNTATGGRTGEQDSSTLAGKQGGRAFGGGAGAVLWVGVTMTDVTFEDNLAFGGAARPNAAGGGDINSQTGGVAQGGGAFVESPQSVQAVRLSLRNNTAQGGPGGDSAPDSGTSAGEGGYAYGGALLISNPGGVVAPPVVPLSIRDSEVVGNRAVGGRPGTGPVPGNGDGAGGLALGGGLNLPSLFKAELVGVRFVFNAAIADQGKLATGGALINPFSEPVPDEDADLTILNTLFRGNTAVGGDDAANPDYRESLGGAFLNNGYTYVSGSRFQGNSVIGGDDTGSGHVGSGSGGAIFSDGKRPLLTINDSTFVGNSALGGLRLVAGEPTVEAASGEGRGGAIATRGGDMTINGGSFYGNEAIVRVSGDRIAAGGAIDIPQPDNVSYLTTTAVRFVSNGATSVTGPATGGAIAFNGTAFADSGSVFWGNKARSGRQNGSAYGGALFLETESRLLGSLIMDNRARAAEGFGGGIALPSGPDALTEVQTSVRRNSATTAGADVWYPATALT